jgi:hypothetical protein
MAISWDFFFSVLSQFKIVKNVRQPGQKTYDLKNNIVSGVKN